MLFEELPDMLEPEEGIFSSSDSDGYILYDSQEDANVKLSAPFKESTPYVKPQLRKHRKFVSARYDIAEGFIEDVHNLINFCSLIKEFDWQSFTDLYFVLHFDEVFCGRDSVGETVHLSEEMLTIATMFFTKRSYSYKDRKATLFLLYRLAYSQPIEAFAKVWVGPENKRHFEKFETEARQRNDVEALFVLGSLHARGHIIMTQTRQECGVNAQVVHGYSDYIVKIREEMINEDEMPRNHFRKAMSTMDTLREYLDCKNEYMGKWKKRSKESVQYVKPNITANIFGDLMKLQSKTL